MPKRKARRIFTVQAEEGYEDPLGLGGRILSVSERAPGTGSRDTVVIKGQLYHRARYWTENAKGVRERKNVYGKSEAEVNKKLAALKKAPTAKGDKNLTLGDFLEYRFLPAMREEKRHNTYTTYKTAVTQYIIPEIGKARLLGLQPQNVKVWLQELDAGARSKGLAFATLRRAYSYAVELQMLDRNPLAEMHAPRVPRTEQRILTLSELRKLLVVAKATEWYALIYMACATAMRQGEIFGLTREALNLNRGYLRVTHQLARTENGPALTEPKTASSRRRVDLGKEAIAILREHLKTQPNDTNLVFTNVNGKPLDGPNFLKRVLRPLLKTAELPAVTFHGLRHSSNTALAQKGVPLKTLQANLGHATSKTTIDVYMQHAPSEGKVAADLMGSLLKGRGGLNRGLTRKKSGSKAKPRTKKKAR
jgi:integrase